MPRRACHASPFALLPRAAEGALNPPPIDVGGTTFILKLNKVTYDEAEACCNSFCGHLAGYDSQDQQNSVGAVGQKSFTLHARRLCLIGASNCCDCCFKVLDAKPPHSPWPLLRCVQVESFYINNGYLLPNFHKHYWMGATATLWPKFVWTDITLPVFEKGYRHWGTMVPSGVKEPYQADPPESCMVANYTEVYGKPIAWGWSDTKCSDAHYPMCRVNSEWHRSPPPRAAGLLRLRLFECLDDAT